MRSEGEYLKCKLAEHTKPENHFQEVTIVFPEIKDPENNTQRADL